MILFAYLDANYLRSETAFRKLYNTVARAERMVPRFTLDPADADEALAAGAPGDRGWKKFKRVYLPAWSVWKSWSIAPFYIALFTLGTGVLIAAAVARPDDSGSTTETRDQPAPPAVVSTTEHVTVSETTVRTRRLEPAPETGVTTAPPLSPAAPKDSSVPPP